MKPLPWLILRVRPPLLVTRSPPIADAARQVSGRRRRRRIRNRLTVCTLLAAAAWLLCARSVISIKVGSSVFVMLREGCANIFEVAPGSWPSAGWAAFGMYMQPTWMFEWTFRRVDLSGKGTGPILWVVPLWPPAALLLLVTVLAWWMAWSRIRAGHCQECGYDRRGLEADAACPECGSLAGRADEK